jgi:hypothetical protein
MNDVIACTSSTNRGPEASRRKAWLLGTASALVIGATLSSPAWAVVYPPATYYDTVDGIVSTGYNQILGVQSNTDLALSATITNGVAGVVEGSKSSAITTMNSFIATAGGNDQTNTVTGMMLPLPNQALPATDGVAVLGDQTNTDVTATSRVANSYFAQELLSNSAGDSSVSDNTMSAATILNNSTTTIQGQVPLLYTSAAPGSSVINGDVSSVDYDYYAKASIIATTVQQNYDSGELAGSGAMVTESYVGELVQGAPSTASVLSGSPTVNANTLSAAFTGNAATTGVTLQAGGAPSFTGSAAVTNAQLNADDAGDSGNPSAIVKYSYVGIGLLPGSGEDASVRLTGSAAVDGNEILATAIGNRASGVANSLPIGNILTIAGGLGLSGVATFQETYGQIDNGEPQVEVDADAIVNNTQVNYRAPLDAETKQNGIFAGFAAVNGGTVSVSTNTIEAQAVGNEVYNALLAPGLGTPDTGSPLDGLFALSNLQWNAHSAITATQYEAAIGILSFPTVDATLTENANAFDASALGNSATNAISLNSSDLVSATLDDAEVYAFRSDNGKNIEFEPYGDVVIESLQANQSGSPVTAINDLPVAGIVAGLIGVTHGSTLSLTNTTSVALAEGNAVSNSLGLTASTINTSAALLNSQSSYSAVKARVYDPMDGIFADLSDSVLALTGNLEQAVATGNLASNALTAAGSSISVSNEGGPASAVQYIPGVNFPFDEYDAGQTTFAGFVAYNDQATAAKVSAGLTFSLPGLTLGTLGNVAGSSMNLSDNIMAAAAFANQANTQLTIAPTNSLSVYLGGGGEDIVYSPFASLTSVQTLADGTNVNATIKYTDTLPPVLPGVPILTTIGGTLIGSTLTTAGNQIQTQAEGNNATNILTLSGTATVAEPAGSQSAGLLIPGISGEDPAYTTVTADAAFALNNLQYAGTGKISAHQTGTVIEDEIGGNINTSTVEIGGDTVSLANVIITTAAANFAANTLTLNASNLSASAGLLNFQVSEGQTTATLKGPVGFEIALDGSVINSTLGIDGNQIEAGATGNAAVNTVSSTAAISSSSLTYSADYLSFFTGAGAFNNAGVGSVVVADLGLLNSQTLGSTAGVLATADGVFTIVSGALPGTGMIGSAASISDNAQLVTATGNQATNSLMLAPGITPDSTTPQTASLLSLQSVTAPKIAAYSDMTISTPITMHESSLTISGNSDDASAVANQAVNTVTINGSNFLPSFQPDNQIGYAQNYNGGLTLYGYGDYSVFNVQTASGGAVRSEATMVAGNSDLGLDAAAISSSSVTFDSNTLVAQALANNAANELSLTAAGLSQAFATVASDQVNGDAVRATATINVAYALGQFTAAPVPVNHTTFAVTNNTTQALATGNQVSNALNVSPTAYGVQGTNPFAMYNPGTGNVQAAATYTVLNSQDNSGRVQATVYGQSPALDLNGIISTGPDQGGYGVALGNTGSGNTANVSGNSVTGQAIGNRASNMLTLVALNTGSASSAINNVQVNTGSVTASVNNVTFGVAANTGTVAHVANNQITASAFGNVATNAIVTH